MGTRARLALVAIILAAPAGAPAWAPASTLASEPGAAVAQSDDGYHLAAWEDGRHDVTYTEWWYFNFADPVAGVQAIFSYFVSDPADIAGLGQVRMVAVAWTPQGGASAIDSYPPAAFSASADEADVTIDPGAGGTAGGAPGTVRVGAGGVYAVRGASADGRLQWDLAYAPESEPWPAADPMPVGRLAWERMSWLVFMPRARVTGTLTLDGRQYVVDAPGYHDHNWGEWIPTDALWNWAQFSTPRAALEIGDFIGQPIGVVALDLDGERTVFMRDQYALVHTRWAWDPVNALFYPVESQLTADNGSLRVQVTLRALATEPLRGDLPAPLKDVIIYEQMARYSGIVWTRSGGAADATGAAGGWRPRALLSGTGFKEYTGKHS